MDTVMVVIITAACISIPACVLTWLFTAWYYIKVSELYISDAALETEQLYEEELDRTREFYEGLVQDLERRSGLKARDDTGRDV
ncbi:membrane protein [Microbacterium phage Morrill]|nr:membrane protein [Microbacterium phage Morrill]